ncbi:MAG: hypothetical protein V3T31_03620, partial [candidate division Zixibacteria bacterium]
GEALILGLKAALHLSALIRPSSTKTLVKYETLVDSLMPLVRRCKIDLNKTLFALRLDKKRRGERPKFILLRKPGSPYIADDITITMARKALKQALSGFAFSGEFSD